MTSVPSSDFLRGVVTGACLLFGGLALTSIEFPSVIGAEAKFATVEIPRAEDLTARGRDRVEAALGVAAETFALVERDHASAALDEATVATMIDGALKALDPNSGYLDRETARRLLDPPEQTKERKLGMRVMDVEGAYIVESVLRDSPARKAGMRPGDRVVRVGDIYVDKDDPTQINQLIQERIEALNDDDELELGVLRGGGIEVTLRLTPEKVVLTGVDNLGVKDGVLHLHIRRFYEGMAEDVREEIAAALDQGRITGLALDLRNNSGGLTSEAVDLADLFMGPDILLYEMTGRHIGVENVRTKTPAIFGDFEISIIVNNRSASAAEIFAGALQAHGRAVIVGWPSFGKGTVQRIFSSSPGAIKITVAEYRDGGLRRIQGVGVTPDIIIAGEDPGTRPSRFVYDPARKAARRVVDGRER